MLIQYQAYANVGSLRILGDVVKENAKTVLMIFNPPDEIKQKLLTQGIYLVPTKPIKRHKQKHKISRIK